MRSAGNFNSEWGYLAPAPSLMRTVRVVLVATAIGATAGAAVVLSLIDRPSADHDRTASIAAHAIVTSVQAAPALAAPMPSSATATLAAPVNVTAAVPSAAASTVQARVPGPATATVTPQPVAPKPVSSQVAMQPPPAVTPPVATAPQATTLAVSPQAAAQPRAPNAPRQPAAAVNPSALEISAASDASGIPAPKPASGFASLSDVPSATETAPAETPDQALIPPQTVPPVRKPKPHAAYASNSKYQPTPGLGTVLRRLFSPHQGTSYYPHR